jgi:hypothetical protein
MKYFALLVVAVVASVEAGGIGIGHGVGVVGVVNTGASAVSRSDDGHGNYAFAYNEDHATGGTFRKEKGGPGVQVGSYGLRDADGRVRVVNYVADALGYRASIQTNEPGVDPKQDPAAVSINGGGYAVAPVAVAAPVIAAPVAVGYGGYGYGGNGYAAGPIASYSVQTQHVAAPLAVGYAAGPIGYGAGPIGYAAGPIGYAGKGYGGHY